MPMEPISSDKLRKVAKHYGLTPIKIKGISSVQICKKMDPKKFEEITWDEFDSILDSKGLQVFMDSSSSFLKIMKKAQ